MVGGGIGVTPYASILNDLVFGTSTNRYSGVACKKASTGLFLKKQLFKLKLLITVGVLFVDLPLSQTFWMVHWCTQGCWKEGCYQCVGNSYIYHSILPQIWFKNYHVGKCILYYTNLNFKTKLISCSISVKITSKGCQKLLCLLAWKRLITSVDQTWRLFSSLFKRSTAM